MVTMGHLRLRLGHLHPVAQPQSEVLEISILATDPTGVN